MFSSNLPKKKFKASQILAIFLLGFFIFSFLLTPTDVIKAQMVTADTQTTVQTAISKIWDTLKKLLQKAGSLAFQRTLSSALNKIAYDAASYIGSGGKGQKPLYTLKGWGDELKDIGDEAVGQFVEEFAGNLSTDKQATAEADTARKTCQDNNKTCMDACDFEDETCQSECFSQFSSCTQQITTPILSGDASASATLGGANGGFNVCQPSSLEAKVKITLGLTEQTRPSSPSCKASDIVKNWSEAANFKNPNFLNEFKDIFDPRGNDLGIYASARSDMVGQAAAKAEVKKTELSSNKGWLDVRDISGKLKGTPGQAEKDAQNAADTKKANFGKTTGDIFIDAANVFLNQLAMSAFNNLMQNLGKKASNANNNSSGGGGSGGPLKNQNADPNILFGESNLKENIYQSLTPKEFGTRADYDILSQLSVCLDEKNPGPANCAIDSNLMQGITEKKTVAEAIKEGYLNGGWQLTAETSASSYSLRNISILRKYRILPIGWEVAIQKANADPNHLKKVTLNDLVSCFDLNDQYNSFSADFNTRDQGWCQGLVDPNWVLKAPLNYCKKQGVSAQILSKNVIAGIKGVKGSENTLSSLNINRAEDYCADEQTCVKEKNDGSCEAYGYCNEEKRIWDFNADSCSPVYNTCQTFTGPDGQGVSYLENTLNYGDCDPTSAGCRQYSLFGAYSTSTGVVSWNINKSLYLNKKTSDCSSKDEGCSGLMRVKPTWGSNLVMNADFGNDLVGASSTVAGLLNDWPWWASNSAIPASRKATIVQANQEPGGAIGKALKLEAESDGSAQGVIGIYSNFDRSLLPQNFQTLAGQAYTVSADVYLAEGHKVSLFIGPSEDGFIASTTVKDSWQHLTVTRPPQATYNDAEFGINGDILVAGDFKFYIKNLKFEMSDWETGYNTYGAYKVYEKILPPYLEQTCYVDATSASKDYRLKDNAPQICSNYARKCNKSEVGCEMYKATDSFAVPAQVQSTDYCPADCLNYDVYVSRETYFSPPQAENLIPAKSLKCNASAVGCSEFTNLDALNQGGEGKEYYSYLKQCIKPGQGTCASFYTWEGTDSGYQLKAYNLASDIGGQPVTTINDSLFCDAQIYNKPVGDPQFNPDCREFYNAAGQVSYHLLSRTVSCSDNCHAYRLSEKNADRRLTFTQCTGSDKHWDNVLNVCYVCNNNGTWDGNHQACVYQAIPGEGKKCKPSESGCREYNGSNGNNVRLVTYSDFENGRGAWYSNCAGGIGVSSISNNKNGHSLLFNPNANICLGIGEQEATYQAKGHRLIEQIIAANSVAAQLKVNNLVSQGLAYNVKFLAQAASDASLELYFYNKDTGQKAYFNASSTLVVKGGSEWAVYQANLEILDHPVGDNEILIISADKPFYFDNFVLSEITDRYYLIRNSSVIPDICYYDTFDNYQGADFNLGCSQYSDRAGLKHNLHQFSHLCPDSAVGCEQMVDTKNYAPYGSGIWNDTNSNGSCDSDEPDCVKISGDSSLYAVYDDSYQCNVADLGCSLLGQAHGTGNNLTWSDVFKKNNPNLYSQNLCNQKAVGCEEWLGVNDGSLSYFKDPGSDVCVYRQSQDPTIPNKAWYKMPVKRCDSNGNNKIDGGEKGSWICSADKDCGTKLCIIDNNDYPCSVSYFKTFGLGGGGNQIPTPDKEVGLCESTASGCTEYIDPVSQFSPNLVYDPSFLSGEGWVAGGQTVKLEPNKLYVFQTISEDSQNHGDVKLDFNNGVKPLLVNNNLGTTTNSLLIPDGGFNRHFIFDSLSNSQAHLTGGISGKTIVVKEAVTDYQLKSNIDKQSCNGLVKFDNGCVLFNERSMNGSQGLTNLSTGWDAYETIDGQSPAICIPDKVDSCTANQLIKARPDRVCAKWLDCLTYVQDPVTKIRTCYAVGECSRLNDKNECASFEEESATSTRQFDAQKDKNATGYSLIDNYYLSQMREVGLNTEAHYDFEDSLPALSCETASSGGACIFDKNIVLDNLVREPEGAPTDYPAHGKSYLRIPSKYLITPQSPDTWISVLSGSSARPGKDYYINYLINTKNSGVGGRIVIKGYINPTTPPVTLADFKDTSGSGWERKIFNFNTAMSTNGPLANGVSKIRIYLGASDSSKDGYVYFDDVNIEPVLETAPDTWLSRECRLYPTNDSLTCFNKDNNTIADGLEGYCLQHDPNNKDVCLMWYPIDRISSARAGQQALGYQGKFPLNYCTEVNGNFDLLQKRETHMVTRGKCNYHQYSKWATCLVSSTNMADAQKEYGNNWYCYNNGSGETLLSQSGEIKNYCGDNSPGRYYMVVIHGWGYDLYYCVPAYPWPIEWGIGGKSFLNNSDNSWKSDSGTLCDANGQAMGIPNFSAWYRLDGFVDNNGASMPKAINSGEKYRFDDSKTANPAIRIFDWDHPAGYEENLKYVDNSDPDDVFHLTCNQFTQTVDSGGLNLAWAVRTSINSNDPVYTPPYFVKSPDLFYGKPPYNIDRYGRNREDIPFGSAIWPDDFNLLSSEPIKLRNQYSKKNNEEIFAGRPFGCKPANGFSEGCSYIGYCSLDPSVYCLTSTISSQTYDINAKSCAGGGYGICVPLWNGGSYLGKNGANDYENILKTLFLKGYNSYKYSSPDGYAPTPSSAFNQSSNVLSRECNNGIRPQPSYSNWADSEGSFCTIYPQIFGLRLKFNDQLVAGNNPFNVAAKGVYRLEFNTEVDSEQQPLREIRIDWGDNEPVQVITGQDHHPASSTPHVFYHYYRQPNPSTLIRITVFDNWGSFGSCIENPNGQGNCYPPIE